MTRSWSYAILAIALVCSGVTRSDAVLPAGDCELSERTPAATHKPASTSAVAQRSVGGHPIATLPRPLTVDPPRTWIVDEVPLLESRTDRVVTSTTARAPPREPS